MRINVAQDELALHAVPVASSPNPLRVAAAQRAAAADDATAQGTHDATTNESKLQAKSGDVTVKRGLHAAYPAPARFNKVLQQFQGKAGWSAHQVHTFLFLCFDACSLFVLVRA